MQDILSSNCLLEEYKPELITEMLDYLTPENVVIFLISKAYEGKTNLKEQYYGAEHSIEDIDKKVLAQMKQPGKNEKFVIPGKNELIPTEFDLHKEEESKEKSKEKSKSKGPVPKVLCKSELLKVWYCKDTYFLKPKVYFSFKLVK